jgi:hypothetical protein
MQSAIRNIGLLICSAFIAAGSAQAQDPAFQFFNTFSGRYHCSGNWLDLTLHINPVTDHMTARPDNSA